MSISTAIYENIPMSISKYSHLREHAYEYKYGQLREYYNEYKYSHLWEHAYEYKSICTGSLWDRDLDICVLAQDADLCL